MDRPEGSGGVRGGHGELIAAVAEYVVSGESAVMSGAAIPVYGKA